uniref:Uncharacterized protein n=1 Tax=Rhizophora mucronata TaxID=61149 RepID=A0A2P2NRP4_RHIMU
MKNLECKLQAGKGTSVFTLSNKILNKVVIPRLKSPSSKHLEAQLGLLPSMETHYSPYSLGPIMSNAPDTDSLILSSTAYDYHILYKGLK